MLNESEQAEHPYSLHQRLGKRMLVGMLEEVIYCLYVIVAAWLVCGVIYLIGKAFEMTINAIQGRGEPEPPSGSAAAPSAPRKAPPQLPPDDRAGHLP